MNNDTQTQEAQEENFVYEVEDETPAVDKKLDKRMFFATGYEPGNCTDPVIVRSEFSIIFM